MTNNNALEMLIDHVGDLFDFCAGNPAEVACLALGNQRLEQSPQYALEVEILDI